jgi:hypothetical protein
MLLEDPPRREALDPVADIDQRNGALEIKVYQRDPGDGDSPAPE